MRKPNAWVAIWSIVMLQGLVGSTVLAESGPGMYVQGSFAVQFPTGSLKDAYNQIDEDKEGLGGSLAIGGFLFDWFALQARAQVIDTRVEDVDGALKYGLYTADAKIYPLGLFTSGADGLLQPYGLVGLGGATLWAEDYDTETNFLFELGFGLDVMLSKNFGIYGEVAWQLITEDLDVDIENANLIGLLVGITYRF